MFSSTEKAIKIAPSAKEKVQLLGALGESKTWSKNMQIVYSNLTRN